MGFVLLLSFSFSSVYDSSIYSHVSLEIKIEKKNQNSCYPYFPSMENKDLLVSSI